MDVFKTCIYGSALEVVIYFYFEGCVLLTHKVWKMVKSYFMVKQEKLIINVLFFTQFPFLFVVLIYLFLVQ